MHSSPSTNPLSQATCIESTTNPSSISKTASTISQSTTISTPSKTKKKVSFSLQNQILTDADNSNMAISTVEIPPAPADLATLAADKNYSPVEASAIAAPIANSTLDKPSTCQGITLSFLENSKCSDFLILRKGFFHLVGNALRWKGDYISNNGGWPFEQELEGYLLDMNERQSTNTEEYTWKCINTGPSTWSFRHKECHVDEQVPTKNSCCKMCRNASRQFYRLCRGEVDQREEGKIACGKIVDLTYKSPSIVIPRIRSDAERIQTLNNRVNSLERIVAKLRSTPESGRDIHKKKLLQTEIFKTKYNDMLERVEIPNRDVFKLMFLELIAVSERVEKFGVARGHEFSPLIIQFAVILHGKVSKKMYNFFKELFNLPAECTVYQYSNSDIYRLGDLNQKSVPFHDFQRYMTMCFDSYEPRALAAVADNPDKKRKKSVTAKSLNLTQDEFDRIKPAPIKRELKDIVRKLARQVDADWHDGYEEQAETKGDWFDAIQEPLQAVLDIGVGKQTALAQCNEVLKIVSDSFCNLLACPCRCDTREDLGDVDKSFDLKLPWGETDFTVKSGYQDDAWSYIWVALLRVHSNKDDVDQDLLFQCIKDAHDNMAGAKMIKLPGFLYDQHDEKYDIDTFDQRDGKDAPDGTKLADYVINRASEWKSLPTTKKVHRMRRAIDRRFDCTPERGTRTTDDHLYDSDDSVRDGEHLEVEDIIM